MANDVIFKLTAEEGQAVQAFLKVVDAQKKSEDQLKRVKDAADNAGRAMEQAGSKGNKEHATFNQWLEKNNAAAGKMGDSLGGMVGKFAPFAGVVAGGTAALAAFKARLDEVIKSADKVAENQKTLQSTLANTGEISLLPEVRKSLFKYAGRNLDQKSAYNLFGAIQQQMGTEASMQDKIEAFKYGVDLKKAGYGDEAMLAGARTFGELRKGVMSDIDGSQIGSITTKLLEQTGGKGLEGDQIKFLNRYVATAKDGKQDPVTAAGRALGVILSAARGEEGGKALNGLLEESSRTITDDDMKGHEDLSPADKDRVKAIESERATLRAKTLELEKQDYALEQQAADRKGGVKEAIERQRHAIALQQKDLSLKDSDLSIELEKVKGGKVTTFSEEALRNQRLNALPQEQRFQAILADPSLAPGHMRAALLNLRDNAVENEIFKAADGDLTAERVSAMAHLENADPYTHAVNEKERQRIHSEQKDLKVNVRDIDTATKVERARAANKKKLFGGALDFAGEGIEGGINWVSQIDPTHPRNWEHSKGPMQVHVINLPQPVKEVVKMNGGNPDER